MTPTFFGLFHQPAVIVLHSRNIPPIWLLVLAYFFVRVATKKMYNIPGSSVQEVAL